MKRSEFVDGTVFSISRDCVNIFKVKFSSSNGLFHLFSFCDKCKFTACHLAYGKRSEITDTHLNFNIRVLNADSYVSIPFEELKLVEQ